MPSFCNPTHHCPRRSGADAMRPISPPRCAACCCPPDPRLPFSPCCAAAAAASSYPIHPCRLLSDCHVSSTCSASRPRTASESDGGATRQPAARAPARQPAGTSSPAGRILFIARGWDPCYRRRPPLLLFIFRARLAAAGLQGRPPLLSAAGGIPCRVAGKPGGGGGLRVAAVGGGTLPAGGGGLIRGGPGTGRGSSGPRIRAD